MKSLRFILKIAATRLGVVCALVTLLACSPKVELPPAKPLHATAEQLAAIPHREAGSHAVHVGEPVHWQLADAKLRVRFIRPEGNGPFPLIVFSHGFAADIDGYDAMLTHWASHGYASIAPYHRDGGGSIRAIFNSVRYGNEGLISERVTDMQQVLDNLDQLDTLEPGLGERIDTTRIVAAGHSFGAFTAQQLGGAAAVDPETAARIEGRDARIQAVIAISPPGEMFGLINAQSWKSLAVPMLATTGTWDMDGRFVTDWRQHRLSWETAPAGQNWLLEVEGADHYLGNLICRPDRDVSPQTDALQMVNASSISFLAYVLGNEKRSQRLFTSDLMATATTGFAALKHR